MTNDESAFRYEGWRVAGASAVGVFFAALFAYGFGVLLKPLAQEFGWSRETTATAYACLALASAVAAPFVGRLVDRYGPVRVAAPCIALSGLGIASLSMLSGSRVHLYLLCTALGLAVIGTSPLAYSRAVVDVVRSPPRRRARRSSLVAARWRRSRIRLPWTHSSP